MMREALPSLRTPTLLRRRNGSGFVATTHSSALLFLAAMIIIGAFSTNLRYFTRAFKSSVPRGVYRRPRKPSVANATLAPPPSSRHCRFLRDATLKMVPPACGRSKKNIYSRKVRLPLLVTSLGGAGSWHASLRLRDAGLRVEHERLGRDGSVCWLYAVRDSIHRPYPVPPAATAVRDLDVRFRKVLHLIRCPVGNVAALSTHKRSTLAFAARALALPPPPPEDVDTGATQLERSVYRLPKNINGEKDRKRKERWLLFLTNIWLGWNGRIERFADARSRIEDDLSGAALCDLVEMAHDGEQGERECLSSSDSFHAGLDTANTLTRAWSHWIANRGIFDPKRCLRGACADGPRIPHHRKHENVSWGDLEGARPPEKMAELASAATRYGYGPRGDCRGRAEELFA